jgi:hypothetical protein
VLVWLQQCLLTAIIKFRSAPSYTVSGRTSLSFGPVIFSWSLIQHNSPQEHNDCTQNYDCMCTQPLRRLKFEVGRNMDSNVDSNVPTKTATDIVSKLNMNVVMNLTYILLHIRQISCLKIGDLQSEKWGNAGFSNYYSGTVLLAQRALHELISHAGLTDCQIMKTLYFLVVDKCVLTLYDKVITSVWAL